MLASNLFWAAAFGAIIACLIQMAREPDRIPAASGDDTAACAETYDSLRTSATSSRPSGLTINANAINQYLATTIKMKPPTDAGTGIGPTFQRAFVRLKTDGLSLGVEQLFCGKSFFLLLDAVPVPERGRLGARATGGAIGRLPVHPSLLPAFQRLFGPTLDGLQQPLEYLAQAKSAVITPDAVILQWPGSAKPSS